MKTKNKGLLLSLCAVLLVAVTALGTMAYLTATDEVKNTFTVGKVQLELDEAKVNTDGEPLKENEVVDREEADRVKANSYKLVPGHTYTKDPTVTVLAESEKSYVRVLVTFTNYQALEAIFEPINDPAEVFIGYDAAKWIPVTETKNTDGSKTYEFRYFTPVEPTGLQAEKLAPLFTEIKLPGTINNTQLETLAGTEMKVVAQAIQVDGFASEDKAWEAFTTN